uniref:Uncharacterized protein n=1 Tax=Arundo donax TaxID=35708 RepID=A0A0A8ZB19_ARUDO
MVSRHDLHTELKRSRDFTGRRRRISFVQDVNGLDVRCVLPLGHRFM